MTGVHAARPALDCAGNKISLNITYVYLSSFWDGVHCTKNVDLVGENDILKYKIVMHHN